MTLELGIVFVTCLFDLLFFSTIDCTLYFVVLQ